MSMIVYKNKADTPAMDKLHLHLYEMEEDNYALLDIYEQLDEEIQEIQNEVYKEEESDELYTLENLVDQVKDLIGERKILTKNEFIDELERIVESVEL